MHFVLAEVAPLAQLVLCRLDDLWGVVVRVVVSLCSGAGHADVSALERRRNRSARAASRVPQACTTPTWSPSVSAAAIRVCLCPARGSLRSSGWVLLYFDMIPQVFEKSPSIASIVLRSFAQVAESQITQVFT